MPSADEAAPAEAAPTEAGPTEAAPVEHPHASVEEMLAASDESLAAEPRSAADHMATAPIDEPEAMASADEAEWRSAAEDRALSRYGDEEEPRRRTGLWLLILLLIVAAAVAAWYFAPQSLRERLGLAPAGPSQLELMITTRDRQQLASGNELLAVSGRVINPTGSELSVPPIRAELRNRETGKLVYRWTIAAPASRLAPGASASFNSAEVDIPRGGNDLTLTLDRNAG